eukprot:910214_1
MLHMIFVQNIYKYIFISLGKDFYGKGKSYGFFSGIDGTVVFFTGKFNEEGLNEQKNILEFTAPEIKAMTEWRKFYEEHEEYTYVGTLNGDFYDSEGKPTQYLDDILAKVAADEKSEL